MKDTESNRLDALKREYVRAETIKELLDIDLGNTGLATDYQRWISSVRRIRQAPDGLFSRYGVEKFLQTFEMVATSRMAMRLGMDTQSLRTLLAKLPMTELGSSYLRYGGALISTRLEREIVRFFECLRDDVFADHTAFCTLLHEAIRTELSFVITPVYCATSEECDESESRLFPYDVDSITLKPLSLRHRMYLDLGKPLPLPPDICSRLFFVRNREAMRVRVPRLVEPADLDEYTAFALRTS